MLNFEKLKMIEVTDYEVYVEIWKFNTNKTKSWQDGGYNAIHSFQTN